MKYFRMSYEEVVYNRSYLNIMLLNRSIPSFKIDNEEEKDEMNREDKRKNKPQKEFKPIEGAIHANDFFMDFM